MTSDKAVVKINISKAQKEKFEKITESENITQVKLIEKLIDIYDEYQELKSKSAQIQSEELEYDELEFEYDELEFEVVDDQDASVTENEIGIVAQARKNSNLSWKQIDKDRLDQLSAVAKHRITKAIGTIRNHNERPGRKSDKYCITKGIASVWIPGICC
ncbi:MAG: hypothetical protein AB4372_30780 [Xenococcus sp. (in: cyanobacteria)]